ERARIAPLGRQLVQYRLDYSYQLGSLTSLSYRVLFVDPTTSASIQVPTTANILQFGSVIASDGIESVIAELLIALWDHNIACNPDAVCFAYLQTLSERAAFHD